MTERLVFREVSLARILANDPYEHDTLFNACSSEGCFYLKLEDLAQDDGQSSSILSMAEDVAKLAHGFFKLPLEEKLQWEMDKWGDMQTGGYKAAGKHTGVFEAQRDGFENFLVPLDAILELDTNHPRWPPRLASNLDLLKTFELSCQGVACKLLSALSNAMPTKLPARFEDHHREQEQSSTSLAMLNYLPVKALAKEQFGHMAHTDVGSLTLLFTSSPGLQVYHRATESWVPVCPKPATVVVNVGDTLGFMSGNVLKTCLHRVVPDLEPPGGLHEARFSLAFFLRPELKATFYDGDGKKWTGAEWHRTKYRIFRATKEEQKKTSLLTGMTGFLGESK